MQTFLPFADFERSAQVLDNSRLNKQRIEAYQIMGVLTGLKVADGETQPRTEGAWLHHPAVLMWKGHELVLAHYANAVTDEWLRRGFADHVGLALLTAVLYHQAKEQRLIAYKQTEPEWLGNQNFHTSHQSNLMRKDFGHYSRHFPSYIPITLPYIWPLIQCPACDEWGRTEQEIFHLKECINGA